MTRQIGVGVPVLRRYERVTFDKPLIAPIGKPLAEFVTPGHPLLDATVDLILERYRYLLKKGTVLVADADEGETPRVLLYLEHAIQDARADRSGGRRVVSKRLRFVEIDEKGGAQVAGYAPYLDYRPLEDGESELLSNVLSGAWLRGELGASFVLRDYPEHRRTSFRRRHHAGTPISVRPEGTPHPSPGPASTTFVHTSEVPPVQG